MHTDQPIPRPLREMMTFSQQTRGVEVRHLTKQHAPDFLLTWRPVSSLRDIFTPDLRTAHLSRANGREATSEAETLQRWLAAGGDLDAASLYGLEIIVGDDVLDRFSQEQPKEEANHGKSGTA